MKPLYCFRLHELSATIIRYTIPEYEIKNISYHGHTQAIFYYSKLGNKQETRWEVYMSDIDRFIHNKLHTFDPDPEHARNTIMTEIFARMNKAYQEYSRYALLSETVMYEESVI